MILLPQNSATLLHNLSGLLFLFSFVFSEEINVYPSLPVQTYENGRFPGIWKFPVSGKGRLNLHAYTEAKENYVKTGCPSWKLFVTMNTGSPVLAEKYYENGEENFFPAPKPWFTDDFDLKQLNANSEVGNMKNISIDLSGFKGNQFLTVWAEEAELEKSTKREIQDKWGLSTSCQKTIQFNLTSEAIQLENETGNQNVTDAVSIISTDGFQPLSKKYIETHSAIFYNNVSAPNDGVKVSCDEEFYFKIDEVFDVGGTVSILAANSSYSVCLNQTPDESCPEDVTIESGKALYVSLPAPGIWFLRASDSSCRNGTLDSGIIGAGLNVTLTGCPGNCGEEDGRGNCKTYFTEGAVLLSTCKCKAGYKGVACSDPSQAMEVSTQLLELLLLTLSNLFFLPAIFIAVHRRYWQEAFLFTIAMGCSTMYHACDQFSTQKYYCIAEYDTLQFSDFVASTAAIWATVLCVADLPDRWVSFLHTVGMFCFAIGAHFNRFSGWLYATPIVVGLVIILFHWCYQCKQRRDCYPPKSAWWCHILPGCLFAAGGFLAKLVFEKEGHHPDGNYFWTHTLWHSCIGLSCAFLLPSINYEADKLYNPDPNLISYYKSFDEPHFEP